VANDANVVTAALPHVFHVRLIGSMQRRVARLMEFDHIPEAEARDRILKSDRGRAHYLRTNFSKDIDDALLYDLVLNTDRVTDEVAARIIAGAAASRCQDARPKSRLRSP
jgi:cytidylate kinase